MRASSSTGQPPPNPVVSCYLDELVDDGAWPKNVNGLPLNPSQTDQGIPNAASDCFEPNEFAPRLLSSSFSSQPLRAQAQPTQTLTDADAREIANLEFDLAEVETLGQLTGQVVCDSLVAGQHVVLLADGFEPGTVVDLQVTDNVLSAPRFSASAAIANPDGEVVISLVIPNDGLASASVQEIALGVELRGAGTRGFTRSAHALVAVSNGPSECLELLTANGEIAAAHNLPAPRAADIEGLFNVPVSELPQLPASDVPTATADEVELAVGDDIAVDVVENDLSESPLLPESLQLLDETQFAELSILDDLTVNIQGAEVGTDVIRYQVCNAAGFCGVGEILISISSADAAPPGAVTCNALVPTIVGTPGDDVLVGTGGVDVIVGLGGNDTITGLAGNDVICGGDGDDVINGNDQIFGEAGNDDIVGESGDDFIDGGDGNDALQGLAAQDTIHGGDGDDDINGGAGSDILDGGNGIDVVDGLWQNDTCDDAETATRCETITFNGEPDVAPPADPPPIEAFQCAGLVASIVGTPGDDVLVGTGGVDVIVGLGGNDTITGLAGNDVICGGDGDDVINGNAGNDQIFGEAGNDDIVGESGDDFIDGGDGNDTLQGLAGQDTIDGGAGDDLINGGSGNDVIDGGPGIDDVDGLWQTDTCDDAETATRCETITFLGGGETT